ETIRKQLRELTGIEEDQYPSEYRQHQLFTGLYDPPTYFVYMLFRLVGFTCYSGEEKTRWETYLRYKDMHFRIRDWKNSTWSIDSIESLRDYTQAKEVAEELKRRIGKASRKLDK